MVTVRDSVYNLLPFLVNPDADALIDGEVERTRIALQTHLGKTDLQVFVEGDYSPLENLLVAYYTAYQLANREALRNLAGENGNASTLPRQVKKAKAGSVETEFTEPSDKNSFILSAKDIAANMKQNVCNTAATLKIQLPLCGCSQEDTTAHGFSLYC
jgi:hypothetical protein